MKTLIIDDDLMSARDLMDALAEIHTYPLDGQPLSKGDPYNGIDEMNHSYELVFVDFQFDESDLSGAEVGLEIRKKYPLATMILVTAHGKDHIMDFIHVGFDAYLDKDRGRFYSSKVAEIIEIGKRNAQARIKSKFDDSEMVDVREKFEAIFEVLETGSFHKPLSISVYGDLYQRGVKLEELKEYSWKVERMVSQGQKVYKGVDGVEFTTVTRQAFNKYLDVYTNGVFAAEPSALKVRQLIMETPEKNDLWIKLKENAPFAKFLKNFDINVR